MGDAKARRPPDLPLLFAFCRGGRFWLEPRHLLAQFFADLFDRMILVAFSSSLLYCWAPACFSRTHSGANAPEWISSRIFLHVLSRTCSSMTRGPRVTSPYFAVSLTNSMHLRDAAFVDAGRRSASARAGTRSKRTRAGIPRPPAFRIRPGSAHATPPHSTACSPKRSVSVSSAKVVSITPGARAADGVCVGQRAVERVARTHPDGRRAGRARRGLLRIAAGPARQGPSGATMVDVDVLGRRDLAVVNVEAVREEQQRAAFRFGATCSR